MVNRVNRNNYNQLKKTIFKINAINVYKKN